MPKILKPEPHLSLEEVKAKYKKTKDPVEKGRLQIIKLLLEGHKCPMVAETLSFSLDYIRKVVHRYNKHGPESLKDKRKQNGGNNYVLNQEQRKKLAKAIDEEEPPGGGLWTGPKIQEWVKRETGQSVSHMSGWRFFKQLGFALKVPRPAHIKKDKQALEQFKKNST